MAEQGRENDAGQNQALRPEPGGNAHADALGYAEAIIATVREPLVVLDGDLRVRTANRSFYDTFRVKPEETEGRLLYDLGNGQWDIPALRRFLTEILPQNAMFDDFEVEHDFPDIGKKVMLLNARKLYREGNHTELILLAIEDVTALREAERARRDAETRFTEMVKNVRDHSIFLIDPNGVITSWNVAAERIIGYTEAEAVGTHYSLIFSPEDVQAGVPEAELRQAREQGRAEDERWHRRKDGSRFWALGIVTPLHDPQGRLTGFSKILRDMTEWKRAGEASRERERQLQLVTDTAPVLIAHCGADLRYKFVNKPYAERFNLHPRDIIGRTIPEVLGEAAFARIRPQVEAALAGQRVEFEADIPYDGSGTQVMRVAYEPERDGSGRTVGLVAAIQNVSDRRRVERERLDAVRLKQVITDNAATGIIMQDGAGRCTFMNPAAEEMTGYTFEELRGKNVHDHIHHTHPDGRHFPMSACEIGQAVMAMKPIRHHEDVFVRKDGTFFPVMCNASPVQQGGRLTEVVLEFRDITEERRAAEALRGSEERFRTLFESMDEGYCVIEVIFDEQDNPADYRFLEINPAFEKQTGIQQAKGRLMREIAPAHEQHWFDLYGRIAKTGETLRFENPAAALGRWYDVCAFRVGPPEVRHVGIVFNDITERRRTQEALRESERRYRSLAEALPNLVWTDLPDGTCDYLSSQWETYTGIPVAELLGFNWLDRVLHPDDRERTLRCWMTAVADQGVYDLEYRIRRHDGQYRWFKTRGVPIRDGRGKIVQWFGTCTDIEDSKRAEQALRDSEERLRLAQQVASIGTFEWNIQTGVNTWTPELEKMYGLEPGQFAGTQQTWEGLVHPDDRAEAVRRVDQAMDQGIFEGEWRVVWPDGSVHWLAGRGWLFKDDADRPLRLIGVNIDITERKRSEEALREQDRRKDEFLATLAHELRNPLAPVRNSLEVLKRAEGNGELSRQARTTMERQVGHMVKLIDDLLEVSRISRGKLELRSERVELASVIYQAVEQARPHVERANHDLVVMPPPEPVYLHADPVRLAQVFTNLLNNACKFTESGGRIWLTAERQGSDVLVSVRDTGIGIPADQLSSIFEMFTQVDRSLERTQGGLGIGLTLVKKLVEMHGGSVEAHSEGVGKGSEFVIRLPLIVEAGPQHPQGPTRSEEQTRGAARRFLVADDNRDAADSLALLLRLAGHEVHTAYDGQEAVEAAAGLRPDVILLDLGMPRLNGYDAARRIREQPWGKGVVMVALTGWGQEEDRRKSKQAGFDGHLVKPVQYDALMSLLAGLKDTAKM